MRLSLKSLRFWNNNYISRWKMDFSWMRSGGYIFNRVIQLGNGYLRTSFPIGDFEAGKWWAKDLLILGHLTSFCPSNFLYVNRYEHLFGNTCITINYHHNYSSEWRSGAKRAGFEICVGDKIRSTLNRFEDEQDFRHNFLAFKDLTFVEEKKYIGNIRYFAYIFLFVCFSPQILLWTERYVQEIYI